MMKYEEGDTQSMHGHGVNECNYIGQRFVEKRRMEEARQ